MMLILVCPCCASPVDAEDSDGDVEALDCGSCGQHWSMVVDADRVAEFALT